MNKPTLGFGAVLLLLGASSTARADEATAVLNMPTGVQSTLICVGLFDNNQPTKSITTQANVVVEEDTTLHCTTNAGSGLTFLQYATLNETFQPYSWEATMSYTDENSETLSWTPSELGLEKQFTADLTSDDDGHIDASYTLHVTISPTQHPGAYNISATHRVVSAP